MRLVKRTVNFDDPTTYHLYYGDEAGTPGTIMTFFPWATAPKGRIGAGQLTVTSFSVPRYSLGYWTQQLVENGVRFEKPKQRFGETVLTFNDPDGLRVELLASENEGKGWSGGPVPPEHSVLGFHQVTLLVADAERTTTLLTDTLGLRKVDEEEGRTRFAAAGRGPGAFVDVSDGTGFPDGSMGVGTVHHVAFRVPDDEAQRVLREEIASLGYSPTPTIDRQYFHSVYFREPGGVLFELATDPPGFAVDEPKEELGNSLKLPPQYEPRRESLERRLQKLDLPREARQAHSG